MQATPEEFSRATCCITIDGERICRWQWIHQTHGLCNHPSRARWSNFRRPVVCIAITSGWQHDLGRLAALNRAYEFSGSSARISLGKEEIGRSKRNLSAESRGFESLPAKANHQPIVSLACECSNAL